MTQLSEEQVARLRAVVDLPDLGGTRYRIERRIGAGGMSTVYLANDDQLERVVALKILTVPDNEGCLAERILREARIIAQLEHPGIIPIHDVGELPDGRVYYAMKHVEGATLEQHRRENAPLNDLLRVVLRVCDAVAFAHSRGILHRDLKPTNIMIGAFGEVLVMDWGIALRVGDSHAPDDPSVASHDKSAGGALTKPGMVAGTPGYMSPEQSRGERDRIDRRTDVYGLGAILYFILTGRAPEDASSVVSIPSPRDLRPTVPKPIASICLKALSLEPADRFQSALELRDDLQSFLDGAEVRAYREPGWERVGRWIGRNQFIVIIALVYILVRFFLIIWPGI